MFRQKLKDLTPEDRECIRDFYEQHGYTQEELAVIFGVSRTTVRRVLDDFEAKVSENFWPPHPDDGSKNGHLEDEWPNVNNNLSPFVNVFALLGFGLSEWFREMKVNILLTVLAISAWAFVLWALWSGFGHAN